MQARPIEGSTAVELTTGFLELGKLRLWIPEGISTNTGNSSVYPVGTWIAEEKGLRQRVGPDDAIRPGNCPKIDENTFECCDIRFPVDQPVEWETTLRVEGDRAVFAIRLVNLGDTPLHKASAAVCLKFLDADWWSDETTLARSEGQTVSLAALGRDAGQPNSFQAYLLRDQTYDHVFYKEFWGFNQHRLDVPLLVSEHSEAGLWVGIQAEQAYFMHSNRGNPCTDLMLAFGDLEPGGSAATTGTVWVGRGRAQDLMEGMG